MHISDIIDELRAKQSLHSDAKAAEFLGISPAALNKIKHGGGMKDETIIKLADGTGRRFMEIAAIMHIDTAKTPQAKKAWQKGLEMMRREWGTAASIILLSSLLTLPSPADASAMEKPSKTVKNYIYIM